MTCTLLSMDRIPTSVPPAFFQRPGETLTGQYHPKSSYIFGEAETLLDKLRNDEYEDHRTHNPHYPFQDEGEWELAKFLATCLTQAEITQFLKLKWVCGDCFSGYYLDEPSV